MKSVGALAFAMRALYGFATIGSQRFDAFEYNRLAENLRKGHGFSMAAHAPFVASDIRLPGYPALLSTVRLVLGQKASIVVLNSVLGAVAVLGLMAIARRLLPGRWWIVVGLVGALYPPLVTYSPLALSEDLSVAALTWFVYGACCEERPRARAGILALTGIALTLGRAEGVVVAVVGALIAYGLRSRRAWALVGVFVLVAGGWAVRNSVQLGRFEIADSAYRDATVLLSVNKGNFQDPTYQRAFAIGRYHPLASRTSLHTEVSNRVSTALRTRLVATVRRKAYSLAKLPFGFVVFSWAERSAGVVSGAARNAVRVPWDIVLLAEYVLAGLTLKSWWGADRRRVLAFLFYPALTFALSVPFFAQPRLWLAAEWVLIVPAVAGARRIYHWWLGAPSPEGAEPAPVTTTQRANRPNISPL